MAITMVPFHEDAFQPITNPSTTFLTTYTNPFTSHTINYHTPNIHGNLGEITKFAYFFVFPMCTTTPIKFTSKQYSNCCSFTSTINLHSYSYQIYIYITFIKYFYFGSLFPINVQLFHHISMQILQVQSMMITPSSSHHKTKIQPLETKAIVQKPTKLPAKLLLTNVLSVHGTVSYSN